MNKIDIKNILNEYDLNYIPVIYYEDLKKLETCILLYEGAEIPNKPVMGHWIAIIKHPKNTWEIFDPNGVHIDTEIDYPVIKKCKKKLLQLCENAIIENQSHIEYNDFNFQKYGSTCALWCILRIIYQGLSCNEFRKFFKGITNFGLAKTFKKLNLLN